MCNNGHGSSRERTTISKLGEGGAGIIINTLTESWDLFQRDGRGVENFAVIDSVDLQYSSDVNTFEVVHGIYFY